ncbi:MAG: SGNH/GDSL hydrolase family protein [bacterium]|nr:SGNH/GDSL hydrolase family protein [bacterium]
MFHHNRMCRWFFIALCVLPLSNLSAMPVKSMVIFGDSISDTGNTTHLLKTLRQEEYPGFIVAPLRTFVLNKMIDFANEYYVPQMVLDSGLNAVTHFFDYELAPYIINLIAKVKRVPILPGKPYWKSRFSNGRVWNEYLAQMWSMPKNNEQVFANKAFGGSWAATYDYQLTVWNLIRHPIVSVKNLIVGKLIPPSLGLTIQAYLLEHQHLNKQAVYFIFSGGNDYLNVLFFEDNYNLTIMSNYIDNVISGISSAVMNLTKAGAERLVIMGIPHLGDTPKFINTTDREVLNLAIDEHNKRLKALIAEWTVAYPAVDFLYIDTQEYMQKAVTSPQQYGFTNTRDACIDVTFPMFDSLVSSPFANNFVLRYAQALDHPDPKLAANEQNYQLCNNPDKYLFWDEIHPSTRAHNYLAFEICNAMKEHGYEVSCLEPKL